MKTEATPALSLPEVTEQVCPEPGSQPFCGRALPLPASFCESGRRDRPPCPPPAPLLQETPPSASIKSLVHSFKINDFLKLHYARLSSSLLTGPPCPRPSLVFTGIWLELRQLRSLWAQSPIQVPVSLTVEAASSRLPSRPHKMGHCSFRPRPHPLPLAPSQPSSNSPAWPCLRAFAPALPLPNALPQTPTRPTLHPLQVSPHMSPPKGQGPRRRPDPLYPAFFVVKHTHHYLTQQILYCRILVIVCL